MELSAEGMSSRRKVGGVPVRAAWCLSLIGRMAVRKHEIDTPMKRMKHKC